MPASILSNIAGGAIGIGVDLVSVARIQKLPQATRERIFTLAELDAMPSGASDARRSEWLAGRFAVKEAVFKALGTGLSGGASWQDIQVLAGDRGAPQAFLSGAAAERLASMGGSAVLVSLTHEGGQACAFAVAVAHGAEISAAHEELAR